MGLKGAFVKRNPRFGIAFVSGVLNIPAPEFPAQPRPDDPP